MKSRIYREELITSWIFGLGSPLALQQHRKLMRLSHFGYRSLSSFRLAALSSACSYSSEIESGTFFFCHSSKPPDMIFDTNGWPWRWTELTMSLPLLGFTSLITTPYFLGGCFDMVLCRFHLKPRVKEHIVNWRELKQCPCLFDQIDHDVRVRTARI